MGKFFISELIPIIRNIPEYSAEDSDYSFYLFLTKKETIIPIIPNIPNIPEYFRILGRGFRLFIFKTFKKIRADYSEYYRIFGILPNIRPRIRIILFIYF